jgi:hypothetical protein
MLAIATLISGALMTYGASAQIQSAASEGGPESVNSVAVGAHEEGPNSWTAEKMRHAKPVPLPKVDPEAVRAAARRQSGDALARP